MVSSANKDTHLMMNRQTVGVDEIKRGGEIGALQDTGPERTREDN